MGFHKEIYDRCVGASDNMRNEGDELSITTADILDRIAELLLFDEKLSYLISKTRMQQPDAITEYPELDEVELLQLHVNAIVQGLMTEIALMKIAKGIISEEMLIDAMKGLFGTE